MPISAVVQDLIVQANEARPSGNGEQEETEATLAWPGMLEAVGIQLQAEHGHQDPVWPDAVSQLFVLAALMDAHEGHREHGIVPELNLLDVSDCYGRHRDAGDLREAALEYVHDGGILGSQIGTALAHLDATGFGNPAMGQSICSIADPVFETMRPGDVV